MPGGGHLEANGSMKTNGSMSRARNGHLEGRLVGEEEEGRVEVDRGQGLRRRPRRAQPERHYPQPPHCEAPHLLGAERARCDTAVVVCLGGEGYAFFFFLNRVGRRIAKRSASKRENERGGKKKNHEHLV